MSKLSICMTDDSRMIAHTSNLSSVGPPNSTTCKRQDNRYGEDATFDVLPSQKPLVVQMESSLLYIWCTIET